MIKQPLSYTINMIAQLPKKEQVEALRQNGSTLIQVLLKFACDPTIKFLLPEGDTPYKPSALGDDEHLLPTELRRLYLFVEGGNPDLKQPRRESLWVDMLNHINPEDAKLMNLIKDKKLPGTLDAVTVKKAFPDLF